MQAQSRNRNNDENMKTPEELIDRFEYSKKLGEGTYGVVYMAEEKAS